MAENRRPTGPQRHGIRPMSGTRSRRGFLRRLGGHTSYGRRMVSNRRPPDVDISCAAYSPGNHRAGTKAHDGRCSWREHCVSPTIFSVTVAYRSSGRTFSYALCELDHRRVHEYFDRPH